MKQWLKGLFYVLLTILVTALLLKYSAIDTNLTIKFPLFDTKPWVKNCSAKQNLIFAKTHKTGSSTLQNIFLRYGWKHNLTFAVPQAKTWMFSFKERFRAEFAHKYSWSPRNVFNFFIFHSIWNKYQVRKLVPNGPVITILRDPVDVFESGYVYMGLEKRYRMDINAFARSKIKSNSRRKSAVFGKNQLLWDLGFDVGLMNVEHRVRERVHELDKQFDLVVIAEQFDESLILLQDLLCWNIKDITYLKLNERIPSAKSKVTQPTRKLLKKWLWADYILYDYFKQKLQDKLEAFPDLKPRLASFRDANDQVKADCVVQRGDNSVLEGKFKMALPIVFGYVVDQSKANCTLYAISEPHFSDMIHHRQNKL